MSEKIVCNNEIVDSIKMHNPKQLVLFYELLQEYKRLTKFDPDYMTDGARETIATVSIKKVREWLNMKKRSLQEINDIILDEMKLNYIKIKYSERKYKSQVIFRKVEINEEKLIFQIDENVVDMVLEEDSGKFSILRFIEFSKFKSRYSQRMYELYVRYRNQGTYKMRIEDFREWFNVPECFKSGNIDQIILNPIMKELNQEEKRVSLKKIKKGRNVTHFHFFFDDFISGSKNKKEDELPF